MRDLISALMCRFRIDLPAVRRRWSVDPRIAYPEAWAGLQGLAHDGLVEMDDNSITVTERGRYLIRNVCMCFDRYLPAVRRGFSRAI